MLLLFSLAPLSSRSSSWRSNSLRLIRPVSASCRGLVGKLVGQFAFFADIVEHQHNPKDVAIAIADRCGGILDGVFITIP